MTAGLIVVLVFLMLLSGRIIFQKHDVQKEIARLEEKANEIEKKNTELSGLINYLNTDEYKERQAREKLNLKKEGEFVVALPKGSDDQNTTDGTQQQSNPQKWFNYFFRN